MSQDIIEQLHHGLNLSDEDVHNMLNEVAHPCADMLVQVCGQQTIEANNFLDKNLFIEWTLFQCHFEGEERDCEEIFIPVITDDGEVTIS